MSIPTNNTNTVTLYGEVISPVEFRSQDKNYIFEECLVKVQNKSMHAGAIRNLGDSTICLIYRKSVDAEPSESGMRWRTLKVGQKLKVAGHVIQDRIDKLGTSSVLVTTLEYVDEFTETQGNARVVLVGSIFKEPVMHKFENSSEKLTFLLEQKSGATSMKTYIAAWNNLANYINDLKLVPGTIVLITGNLVSRKYLDKKTGREINLCEVLAKKLTVLHDVSEDLPEIPKKA